MKHSHKTLPVFVGAMLLTLLPLASRAQLTIEGDTLTISAGAIMSVDADIQTLSSGSNLPVFKNDGKLLLGGDFDLQDSADYSGPGMVELGGSIPQHINGGAYNVLRISGTGVKYLEGNVRVIDSLKCLGGVLNTALNQDTLILEPNARIVESATSYVSGWVRTERNLAQNIAYDFGGIGLDFNAAGGNPGLTTIVRGTGDSAIQTGIGQQSVKRVFFIHPANNGGLNASITFQYQEGELNGFTENDLALYKSVDTGRTWKWVGYASRDANANTLSMNGVNSFSHWTAGSMTAPLPVELLSFEAKLMNEQEALLTWVTTSEINNDHFDIERSLDGKRFIKVGEKAGQGTTSMRTNYRHTDRFGHTTASALYYRLKQVDYNGTFKYSDIRRLNLQQRMENGVTAAIQPGTGKLVVRLSAASAQTFQLRLVDLHGRVLLEKSVNAPQGVSELSFDMGTLAQSVYHLTAFDGEQVHGLRVLRR